MLALPPVRFLMPLLVLVFGLAIMWLDYELNVANDLERNLTHVQQQCDATGMRLARASGLLLKRNEFEVLRSELVASDAEPWLETAALVNAKGRVLANSDGLWEGSELKDTPLAPAARLISHGARASVLHSEDRLRLFGAYPVEHGNAWVVIVFDRTKVIAEARADARRQLGWISLTVTLLCLALWTGLHFGFAKRIGRLMHAVRAFGEDKSEYIQPFRGGDEIAQLSTAFAAMSARVKGHQQERASLEREVHEASERERHRIGHELHDNLGQRLTAAALATDALGAACRAQAPEQAAAAENISRQLRSVISETRELSHGLAPVRLDAGGLMDALAGLAEATGRSAGVRAVFECPRPVDTGSGEWTTQLFRIAQEAVQNSLKHAAPSEIRIGLEQQGGEIVLEVEDDGQGLPEPLPVGEGMGLRVMRHRADLLHGKLEATSSPAGGTLIRCRCPFDGASA